MEYLSRAAMCAKSCTQGTSGARDGEFLHDFRVATRRTRTALRQVRRAFPKGQAKRLAQEFRWLARLAC